MTEANEWEVGKRGSQSITATDEDEAALDEAMELQMISIRLPLAVVEKLKALAKKEGIAHPNVISIQATLISVARSEPDLQLIDFNISKVKRT